MFRASGVTSSNSGMRFQALMVLLGHVTPEMTLRYANPRIAHPTVCI